MAAARRGGDAAALAAPVSAQRAELTIEQQNALGLLDTLVVQARSIRDDATRIPSARVRRALRSLRAQLPEGRPLAAVRVAADGDRVVVQDGGARWHREHRRLARPEQRPYRVFSRATAGPAALRQADRDVDGDHGRRLRRFEHVGKMRHDA